MGGKLQMRKSGKVQLEINNVLFDVEIGTQVGFLQELYSVEENQGNAEQLPKNSHLTNLGRVRNRVIAMPAWKNLFEGVNNPKDTSSESESESDMSWVDSFLDSLP